MSTKAALFYIHDPMCSWCWGFDRTRQELFSGLPEEVSVVRLLGGLAPDNCEPMDDKTREYVQSNWRRIEERIPGVRFNFDFWSKCRPRRSTYPACRAVIAAREQGDEFDPAMTAAIQRAYYREARNPSDDDVLIELAGETGLDTSLFSSSLNSAATNRQLMREMAFVSELGATGLPNLVLDVDGSRWPIPVDYNDADPMLELIGQIIKS